MVKIFIGVYITLLILVMYITSGIPISYIPYSCTKGSVEAQFTDCRGR